jgi:hypothetical protein
MGRTASWSPASRNNSRPPGLAWPAAFDAEADAAGLFFLAGASSFPLCSLGAITYIL